MNEKLAAVGLVDLREHSTLKAFIDDYVGSRSDIKDRSVSRIREAGEKLIACFGAEKRLRDFTLGDGPRFRQWLLAKGLAENTVRRNCGRAKQFFWAAIRQKLVAENPFSEVVSAVRANTARMRFIDLEMTAKIFEACPTAEWRLIFALSRFGGVRCPSETLSIRWSDVDWKNNRIRIPSPKTEHIEGKESRVIPLFPELRPHLETARKEAGQGGQYLVMRYRSVRQNLATQFERIVCRAGLEPWPKLFQNLRSTRETELMETYPAHVVCAWIGNSESVAQKHYLQITDEHFAKAVRAAPDDQNAAREGGALQKALQHTAGSSRMASYESAPAQQKAPVLPGLAALSEFLHEPKIPLRGFEPRLTD